MSNNPHYFFVRCDTTGEHLVFDPGTNSNLGASDDAGDHAMWRDQLKEGKIKSVIGKQMLRVKRQKDDRSDSGVKCKLQHPDGGWLRVDEGRVSGVNPLTGAPHVFTLIKGPSQLPSEHVSELRARGFTVLDRVAPPAEVALLREEFVREADKLGDSRGGERRILKVLSSENKEVAAAAARAVLHPVALWIQKEFLDDDVVYSHPPTVNVIMPAKISNGPPKGGWHSDYPYKGSNFPDLKWPKDTLPLAVQYNICIDEFRLDNAATQFVPGSHLMGVGPPQEWNVTGARPRAGMSVQQMTAPAGSAILYDARTWHRACPELNVSGNHRLALLSAATVAWVDPSRDQERGLELAAFDASSASKLLSARELRLLWKRYLADHPPPPGDILGARKVVIRNQQPFTSTGKLASSPEPSDGSDGDLDDLERRDYPVLVCWHPGGFKPKDGSKMLEVLMATAFEAGLEDQLVLSYPETYGIEGEGCERWSAYVDELINLIDKSPKRAGRSLLLWAHGSGVYAAMSVASRLEKRVLKVYLNFNGPPVVDGYNTMVEAHKWFRTEDEMWLQSLVRITPENAFLQDCSARVLSGSLDIKSAWLQDLLRLSRRHYINQIYPDVQRDLKVIASPILAVTSLGASSVVGPPDSVRAWSSWTSGEFRLEVIDSGLYDCLQAKTSRRSGESFSPLIDLTVKDMAGLAQARLS